MWQNPSRTICLKKFCLNTAEWRGAGEKKKFFIRQNSQRRRKDIDWTFFSAAHSLLFRWKNSINRKGREFSSAAQEFRIDDNSKTKPVTMTQFLQITLEKRWVQPFSNIKKTVFSDFHSSKTTKRNIFFNEKLCWSIFFFASLGWFVKIKISKYQIFIFTNHPTLFWHNLHHPIKLYKREASSQIREVQ